MCVHISFWLCVCVCVLSVEGGGGGGGGCEPSCCISSSPRVPTLLFSARLSLFYRSHHMLWLVGPFRGRPLKVRARNTTSSNPPLLPPFPTAALLFSRRGSGHQIEWYSGPGLGDGSPPMPFLSRIRFFSHFMSNFLFSHIFLLFSNDSPALHVLSLRQSFGLCKCCRAAKSSQTANIDARGVSSVQNVKR